MSENEIELLLVEDDPNDVELALRTLRKHHLANKIHVARDGEEALDFSMRAALTPGEPGPNCPRWCFSI